MPQEIISKPMIDPQLFQLILWIGGILLTCIGFLIGFSIKNLKQELKNLTDSLDKHEKKVARKFDEHEKQIASNTSKIDGNTKLIEANSEKDKMVREMMDKKMDEIKDDIKGFRRSMDENGKKLTEVLLEIKKN